MESASSAPGRAQLIRESSISIGGISDGHHSSDLIDTVLERVRLLACICAASILLYWIADDYLQPSSAALRQHFLFQFASLGVVLLALIFLTLQVWGLLTKAALYWVGLGVLTAQGLLLSVQENVTLSVSDAAIVGSPACALWLVLCSVVVPFNQWAIGGMSSALLLLWPVTYWVPKEVLGQSFLGWNRIMIWVMPIALSAVWALYLNRHLYRLVLKSRQADEIGSYHLEYLLARGGMGEVWVAKHRLLSRRTAVKVIRPEVLRTQNMRAEAVTRKRFEREATATSSLRNPHTVSLYDFGVAKDGSFYYVMELLEGIDLQDLVDRFGPVQPGRVRNIMIQVCESLDEAHNLGMVHRDIKPRNIFLSNLGWTHDFAKVLDFGLVKTSLQDGDSFVTVEGSAAGTPAYMPPECSLGGRTIDGRADIYALGCVAYFLLSGVTVFEESTPTALAVAHLRKTPRPPSQRTEIQIPQELIDIVMHCLEKEPENRPRSAFALAQLLRGASAIPEFSPRMASEWWNAHRPSHQSSVASHEN